MNAFAHPPGSPEAWPVGFWHHGVQQITAPTLDSAAERMLACVTHLYRGGGIADLAAIDPQGSAATEYDFLDE